MSTFNGRPGPNMSQFMRSLDTDPDPQSSTQDELDLNLYTNTQWFDFDSGQTTDFQPQPIKTSNLESSSTASPSDLTAPTPSTATTMPDMSSSIMFPDISFDFSQFPITPQLAGFPDSLGAVPAANPTSSSTSSASFPQSNPTFPQTPRVGDKRKANDAALGTGSGAASPLNPEDASRLAAEEDKRRRNTAASARFRHKKKQREQEMERKAKESEEKISKLEARVQTLLAENKWLKNMILEKTGGSEDVGKKLEELSRHLSGMDKERVDALVGGSSSKEKVGVKEEKS